MSLSRKNKAIAAGLLIGLALAGCAKGPADFMDDFTTVGTSALSTQPVRTPDERERLARDLDATAARQSSAGRSAGGTLPSAMALTVIRQQQEEEARALLEAATEVPPPAPMGDDTDGECDPNVDAFCAPVDE
jgi:hypothetical protein